MSYNSGGSNKKNKNEGRSYGIFGEATSFIKQKLPISFNNKSRDYEEEEDKKETFERKPLNQNTKPKPPQPSFNQRPIQNVPQGPKNFFVFDIETVPCIETAKTLLNLPEDTPDGEVVQKLTAYHSEITGGQNEFFRQPFHKVVCVSFIAGTILQAKYGKERYIVRKISSGGRKGESEEEILRGIFSYLNKYPSRLISFNGRGFDMPVLQYRAMKYGIDAKWIYSDNFHNYNHRYSVEKHCDLLEMFSNFGASARVKMTEVCALFKIPCKNNGIDGSAVYNLFKEGKTAEIADYCESDVVATFLLYLRFMQHSGKLSAEGYNIVVDNLSNMLLDENSNLAHKNFITQFLDINNGDIHIKTTTNNEQKPTDSREVLESSPEDELASDVMEEILEEADKNTEEDIKEEIQEEEDEESADKA
jgi:predicted PolB exonuclease-like 3'-5' exonuclease